MTELLPNIFTIPIPDNARDFCFIAIAKDRKAVQWTFDSGNGLTFMPETNSCILPPGSYEILFTTKGVTEQQAVGVVDQQLGNGKFNDYCCVGSLAQYGGYIYSTRH